MYQLYSLSIVCITVCHLVCRTVCLPESLTESLPESLEDKLLDTLFWTTYRKVSWRTYRNMSCTNIRQFLYSLSAGQNLLTRLMEVESSIMFYITGELFHWHLQKKTNVYCIICSNEFLTLQNIIIIIIIIIICI